MSFYTAGFFYQALLASDVNTEVDGRIFSTDRTTEEAKEDRIPYIVINDMGGQNQETDKDENEGDYDSVTVELMAVADTSEALADLCTGIREVIREAQSQGMIEHSPISYSISFSPVEYDREKDCHYRVLIYNCDTNR